MSELSLIALRKRANELGIENYAKFAKEELVKLIEQAEAGVKTVIDPEYITTEEDAAAESQMVAEHAATVAPDAEDPDPEVAAAEKKVKKEKKAKEPKVKKEKKAKEPKVKKEKKAKVAVTYSYTPKNENKPELHETSSKIYDELLKNDGRSYGKIATDLGTHYNMVRRAAETYFVITASDQAVEVPAGSQEAENSAPVESAE